MIKRIIIFIMVISISILLFTIPSYAEVNSLYEVVDQSTYSYSVTTGNRFNYLFVRNKDIDDVCGKINDFSDDFILNNCDINIYTDIGNDVKIHIKFEIKEENSIYFYINDIEFIVLKSNRNECVLGDFDLRKYGEYFNYSGEFYSDDELNIGSINNFIDSFKDKIGLNYLCGVTLVEHDDGYAVMKGEEPDCFEILSIYGIPDTHIVDFGYGGDGRYNDGVDVGTYIIYEYNLTYGGLLEYNVITMCVIDSNALKCRTLNISYMDNINKKEYRENYIEGPTKYFDPNKYNVVSDYFYREDFKEIQKYFVEVFYNFEGHMIRGYGYINVIDDVKPYFIGDDIIEGNLSKANVRIDDIFYDIKAYDEIDGDISDRIKVTDLDNYKDNYDKEGEYRFLLSVSDNTGNEVEKIFKYRLIDDTRPIEDDTISDENKNEEIDIIDDNSEIIEEVDDNIVDDENEVNDVIDEEDKNEEIIENIIYPAPIKTNTNNILSIDDIKKRLVFSGYISDDFNGEIITDYIGNENKEGEYLVSVIDDNNKIEFKILVEKGNQNIESSNNGLIIGVIVSVLGVGIVVLIILLKVKKRKIFENNK